MIYIASKKIVEHLTLYAPLPSLRPRIEEDVVGGFPEAIDDPFVTPDVLD